MKTFFEFTLILFAHAILVVSIGKIIEKNIKKNQDKWWFGLILFFYIMICPIFFLTKNNKL